MVIDLTAINAEDVPTWKVRAKARSWRQSASASPTVRRSPRLRWPWENESGGVAQSAAGTLG